MSREPDYFVGVIVLSLFMLIIILGVVCIVGETLACEKTACGHGEARWLRNYGCLCVEKAR